MKPKLFFLLHPAHIVIAFAVVTQSASATDANWTGASGGTQNWQTATNWSSNPAIPTNAGDTATFTNTLLNNTTIQLNGAVTIGSLVNLDTNNEINIQNGTGGSITFDTGSVAVPTIDVSARTNGVGLLLYATVNGSNGLSITGSASTTIRVNRDNTDWAGFSGGLAITQGLIAPQAGNYNYSTQVVTVNKVLPTDERLSLGSVGTTTLQLSSSRDIAVGSLAGTSNAAVYNSTTGGLFAVLAVGNDNTSGSVFAGTVGALTDGTGPNMLHVHKIGSGTQEFSGKVRGTGNVTVYGGTLILSDTANGNDYTGTTTVNSGATLKIGSASALGNVLGGNTSANGTTVNSGGTLDLNGQTIGEVVSVSGSGVGSNGALINSNTTTAATLTTDIVNPGNLSIGGAGDLTLTRVRSNGTFTVTKVGNGMLTTNGSDHNNLSAWDVLAGTVIFANTSGYGADRGVAINGGTLKLSGANSNLINDGQAFTVNSGAFDLNGKNEAVASIGGSGGTIRNNAASTTSTLFVGGGSGGSSSATFAGGIEDGAGTLKLTKEGTGTQTLTGINTYTGATAVNAGKLVINGSSSSTVTTVASGATLGGVGSLAGTTTIQAGGFHGPGNSPGVQSFTNLTYNDDSIFLWEIDRTAAQTRGTGYDGVNVSGTLAGLDGGDANATFDAIFRVVIGDAGFSDPFWSTTRTWSDIFTTNGTTPVTNWTSLFGGGIKTYTTGGVEITDTATYGSFSFTPHTNSLTWSAVPEPSTAVTGLLLSLGLLRRRRQVR
jgi:autotransporter-associated beta strand protein